ncbi:MAG: deoxyribodipyrimidine photo-lyase [Lysobacteraceae bacterium]|nr:MAG: deoxyribodipyrimidine photo-lyase [Xanthomonadaceae bacterium]
MRSLALVWLWRDLRLADHPALCAALEAGHAPQLVFIDDPDGEGGWPLGAAARIRLRHSLDALGREVRRRGGRLLLRRGRSLEVLRDLIRTSGAVAVYWNRRVEPALVARDREVERALVGEGIEVRTFWAAGWADPATVRNRQGLPWRVFTPFWRHLQAQLDGLGAPLPAPRELPPCALEGLEPEALVPLPRPRWDRGFGAAGEAGEAAAWRRLDGFLERLADYPVHRDRPDLQACSGLSTHLALGEIGPQQILARLRDGPRRPDAPAQSFLRQIGWREFAIHLLWHFPQSADADLTPALRGLAWREPDPDLLRAWQQGRTGIPLVDAGMRELWATGRMHNRVRMVVASLLTRNLRYHWRHGARWFWDTLVDADLANNTLGWQWVAGTGADAAPYFRIFNPVTQGERFDPDGAYVRRWVPELRKLPARWVHRPWQAPAGMRLGGDYSLPPRVDLAATREAALAAYRAMRA